MKRVWVFRHSIAETRTEGSIGPELALSPEGKTLIPKMISTFLKCVDFKDIQASPLVRAFQTGMLLSLGLKKPYPAVNYSLYSRDRRWSEVQNKPIISVFKESPDLISDSGSSLLQAIEKAASEIERGSLMLISHGGLIESAAIYATVRQSKWRKSFSEVISGIPNLRECEGIVFTFDSKGEFCSFEEKRFS